MDKPVAALFSWLRTRLGIAGAMLVGASASAALGAITSIAVADGFLSGLSRAGLEASRKTSTAVVASFGAAGTMSGIFSGVVLGSGIPASGILRKTLSAIAYAFVFIYVHAFLGLWMGASISFFLIMQYLDKAGSGLGHKMLVATTTSLELTLLVGLASLPFAWLIRGMIGGMRAARGAAISQGDHARAQLIQILHAIYMCVIYMVLGLLVGLALFFLMRANLIVPLPSIEDVFASRAAVIWLSVAAGFFVGSGTTALSR